MVKAILEKYRCRAFQGKERPKVQMYKVLSTQSGTLRHKEGRELAEADLVVKKAITRLSTNIFNFGYSSDTLPGKIYIFTYIQIILSLWKINAKAQVPFWMCWFLEPRCNQKAWLRSLAGLSWGRGRSLVGMVRVRVASGAFYKVPESKQDLSRSLVSQEDFFSTQTASGQLNLLHFKSLLCFISCFDNASLIIASLSILVPVNHQILRIICLLCFLPLLWKTKKWPGV